MLQYGRVLEYQINAYALPSSKSKPLKFFWKDAILPVTAITLTENENDYNRIWYQIGEDGYVYSGVIQPVQKNLNKPVSEIPGEGLLAEVTVPFTDSYWGPGRGNLFAYRYYYETTFWVLALVQDAQGNPWYAVWEDKWDMVNYVPASHLRILPPEEIAPLSPEVPPEGKRLEIRLEKQILIAYEWDRPVFTARIASGARFSTGNYETSTGRFMVYHKMPSRHMAAGDIASNGYDLPGVPWVSYFTEEGVSIHGTYWHNDFGKKRSHGCINLTPQAAKWVYRWTAPVVPTGEKRVYETSGSILDILPS